MGRREIRLSRAGAVGMPHFVVASASCCALVFVAGACNSRARAEGEHRAATQQTAAPKPVTPRKADAISPTDYPVAPPPFTEDIFPCSECHEDQETNRERRKLTDEHETIALQHGPRERWCFDCHDPDDRDHLRLASGALVPFTESYRLCGQCHGPKLRDWRVGVHGKRVGRWDGRKQYLLCAHCHDPHAPHFKPIQPMPPPVRPGDID